MINLYVVGSIHEVGNANCLYEKKRMGRLFRMLLEAYRENISREVPLVPYLPPVCVCVSRSSAKPKVEILEPDIHIQHDFYNHLLP